MDGARFALIAAALIWSGAASAAPLSKEDCQVLRAEQAQLVSAGARQDMDRGPEWAKLNLATDRLQRIQKLISLDEQLIFRCSHSLPATEGDEDKPATKAKTPKANDATGEEPKPKAKKKKTQAAEATPEEKPKPAKKAKKPTAEQ